MLLVQISDTHFGTEQPAVLEAVVQQVQTLQPDLVVLAGDITQRARAGQFQAAAKFMARLPARHRIVIPGNHDIPLFNLFARFLWPYAGFERAFGARQSLWQGGGVTVLALDATDPWRHKDGYLAPQALRARLAEARALAGPEGLLVVAAHQPLWTAWDEDGQQTLIDREETARLISAHRVDVVLSGHVHVPLIAPSTVGFQNLPWVFVLSATGTAVSHRVRAGAPNSFNTIELEAGQAPVMTLCRYDYVPPAFRCIERHRFRRGPPGWVSDGAESKP